MVPVLGLKMIYGLKSQLSILAESSGFAPT